MSYELWSCYTTFVFVHFEQFLFLLVLISLISLLLGDISFYVENQFSSVQPNPLKKPLIHQGILKSSLDQ